MDFGPKILRSLSTKIWSTLWLAKVAVRTDLKLGGKPPVTTGRASLGEPLLMSNGAAFTSRVLSKIMSNELTAGILANVCK